jgi:hypothetical protein
VGLGIVFLLSGCATTTFKSTWADPAAGPIRFDKTLVVFMSSEEAVRRSSEDRLVQYIGPERSAPSYTLLSSAEIQDKEKAKEKVRAAGFDGVVVMRTIGKREQVTYVPPSYYHDYWGYNSMGWGAAYDPGYLSTDTTVSVETNIYSLADEKLIWSGLSETFDPGNTPNMVDEIAKAAAEELERRGLIP